ncbi:hypothetical protein Ae201684P_008626 [Aphanomyces euteiches]|uniref:Uncharacterized protein n=1 Tax=Aphanomyces euteiches TaxID=100861 RepID=A0A6G0XNU5_9STRA|nr:hypothetical protein Ae201684_002802 [Aphanomyces euteiches]KAH9092960.1 hypothetical protein Ae201684P_008626 [Aphanomyces euteiches]KAH9133110.1 hypothetical protein AeRB84_020750 [Aphanomyces euteiches]
MNSKPPKVIVEWCPYDSALFAVGSESLSLYECQYERDNATTSIPNSSINRPSAAPTSPRKTTQRRNKDAFRIVHTDNDAFQVRSMQWCPLPRQLIAAGVGAGKVVVSDFTQTVIELLPPRSNTSTMMSNSASAKGSRSSIHANIGCNAVAWNQHNPHQIAAGFEKVRADCCAFVWDLSTQSAITSFGSHDAFDSKVSSYRNFSVQSHAKPTITNELANSEAVVGMAWLPSEPSCLATGTGFKWLRIYDVRTKTTPMDVSAHSKGVFGVVFDQYRPHMLATFSDDPKEPVKVWDIRSIQSSRQNGGPIVSIFPSGKSVTQIAWSPTQAGILATTTIDERSICLWDVENQIQLQPLPASDGILQIRKPFKRRSTKDPVFAFSWQSAATTTVTPSEAAVAIANPNRMLIATVAGKLENLSIHDTMPLAISSHDAVGFACGKLLFSGDVEVPQNNIAADMMRRVKAGYSMNVLTSLQLFVKDEETRDLRFVWQWVEQVESLRRLSIAQMEIQSRETRGVLAASSSMNRGVLRAWPVDPQALISAGVQHLLGLSKVPSPVVPNETSLRDPVLGCLVYDSLGRRTSLLACQWDPECGQPMNLNLPRTGSSKGPLNQSQTGSWLSPHDDEQSYEAPLLNVAVPNLQTLIQQCETTQDYDRAAALAVFHGDLQAAVTVLQRGAESPADAPTRDVRQLVAMAVAGYSIGNSGPLWGTMCQQLLKRPEVQNRATPRYLHAVCSFLFAARELSAASHALPIRAPRNISTPPLRRPSAAGPNGGPNEESQLFVSILNDETLLLSDRTAFACRFLPLDGLTRFIDSCVEMCIRQGNLQGLLLVGLEPSILQEYLDRTGDIQTVALLVARVTSDESSIFSTWIAMYRDLLNQWQLFHQRALFDVGRAQLEGQLNGFRDMANALNPNAHASRLPDKSQLGNQFSPQLYVRCNFCGSSLSLSSLLRVGAGDWLLKAKPKLNNCPSCKKPLPQCALCLLPFGTLNPYLELAMRKGDRKHSAIDNDPTSTTADNLSELSSIPFVEWFTWCQTCKHGGHAHHMANWFATHDVCPVSDCDCPCKRLDTHGSSKKQTDSMEQATLPDGTPLQAPTHFKSPNLSSLTPTMSGLTLGGLSF